MERRRPDFVIPGFARCGTTWLYETLRRHPGIFLPERKELDFFSESWEKGYPFYAAYFAEAGEHQLTGDISPVYAEHPEVPERLAATSPAGQNRDRRAQPGRPLALLLLAVAPRRLEPRRARPLPCRAGSRIAATS